MSAAPPARVRGVVRIGPRTAAVLTVASLAGLAMFTWPLLLQPPEGFAHVRDAPYVFVGILPLLLVVVLVELREGAAGTGAVDTRTVDTKAIALLAVLSAVGAVLRPLGAGTAGIELVFFMLVPAGRVLGAGFGFVLGCTTLFTSALLTGGVGPWLPFQMMAAGWVGLFAGLLPLPRLRGRGEVVMLAVYGAVSAYAYGLLLNLTFWPFALGGDTALSYVPGGALAENLQRFLLYTLTTSAVGWDTGRALTNLVAILLAGPALLAALRRASRRARFDAVATFSPTTVTPTAPTTDGPARST